MVEIAPQPPGFIATPLDTDNLPPAKANRGCDEPPAKPPRIRSKRGGADDPRSLSARLLPRQPGNAGKSRRRRALVRRLRGNVVQHAFGPRRRAARAEDAAGDERRAGPDPRAGARPASSRGEALAELERLRPLADRARELVEDLYVVARLEDCSGDEPGRPRGARCRSWGKCQGRRSGASSQPQRLQMAILDQRFDMPFDSSGNGCVCRHEPDLDIAQAGRPR
jgi:hypothetical protein